MRGVCFFMDYELMMNGNVKIGQKAPNFEAVTTFGNIKLEDYNGKWLVLFSDPCHQMYRIKRFLSLSLLVGVLLVGIFLPTHFSVAQNYHDLTENSFLNRLLNFIMPNYEIYLHATTEPNRYTIYFDGN